MKNKLVTVIIPVYNGEQFIERCVKSVVNQNNFDVSTVEILLINDGSQDNSLTVLKGLHSDFPFSVTVYTQENSGVAKTRNRAIKLAKGKYTIFIDQDDYLDKDYLSTFFAEAEAGSYDIVVGGYRRPDAAGRVLKTVSQPGTDYAARYKVSAAWAKIHRTDFLQSNDILFYDNSFGEDIIFTMQQSSLTDKIKGIPYVGYNWFWNTESVSNTQQRSLKNKSKILGLIKKMIPYATADREVYYLVQTAVYYLLYSGKESQPKEFIQLYKDVFGLFQSEGVNITKNKLLIVGPKGAAFSTRFAVGAFLVLRTAGLIPAFARFYCKG